MRVEKVGKDHWFVTWAFSIKEIAAEREGYDKTTVMGTIEFSGEYPGCPYCGRKELTLCSCGHLNCTVGTKYLHANGAGLKDSLVHIPVKLLLRDWII